MLCNTKRRECASRALINHSPATEATSQRNDARYYTGWRRSLSLRFVNAMHLPTQRDIIHERQQCSSSFKLIRINRHVKIKPNAEVGIRTAIEIYPIQESVSGTWRSRQTPRPRKRQSANPSSNRVRHLPNLLPLHTPGAKRTFRTSTSRRASNISLPPS